VVAVNKIFQGIMLNPKFSPTARKFHYIFNLRDISRVVEGLLMCKPEHFRGEPIKMAQCFIHECKRVFQDRL